MLTLSIEQVLTLTQVLLLGSLPLARFSPPCSVLILILGALARADARALAGFLHSRSALMLLLHARVNARAWFLCS